MMDSFQTKRKSASAEPKPSAKFARPIANQAGTKMKRQVLDRLFMASLSVAVTGTALFEPTSTSHFMTVVGGSYASLSIIALLLLNIAALADTVINDMLPEPYLFKTGWKFRQGIWMLIAITFIGTAFVAVRMELSLWLAGTYTLYGMRCASISFMDLYYDHRGDVNQGRRSTDFGDL